MSVHKLHRDKQGRELRIALIGAGGNGSQMLTGLAQLNHALRALGKPGFTVAVIDDDRVSEANVGRQMFYPADVGQYKAVVLVHRINVCFGTEWKAFPARLAASSGRLTHDILIGCVDNAKARNAIRRCAKKTAYWLDLGNQAFSGQVVLGEMLDKRLKMRLPNIADLFPEVVDWRKAEDNEPSCSMAEALAKQELFTNRAMSTFALDLLWRLLRYGEVTTHGVFVNLKSGRTAPLPIDPLVWERFGFKPKASCPPKDRRLTAGCKKEPSVSQALQS